MITNEKPPCIGGLQPLTLLDFPGRLSSVIFMQGCNLRCPFCHNPDLVKLKDTTDFNWQYVYNFLEQRRSFIEAVVFSGGEPTMQPSLFDAASALRRMGFEIAVHTNGFFPDVLKMLLKESIVSFIAIDYKAPRAKYERISGIAGLSPDKLLESIGLTVSSGVQYEIRMTYHPYLLDESDLKQVSHELSDMKVERFVLQQFRNGRTLDPNLPPLAGNWISETTVRHMKSAFRSFSIRASAAEYESEKPFEAA